MALPIYGGRKLYIRWAIRLLAATSAPSEWASTRRVDKMINHYNCSISQAIAATVGHDCPALRSIRSDDAFIADRFFPCNPHPHCTTAQQYHIEK